MDLEPIPLVRLLFVLGPAAAAVFLMWRWRTGYAKALYAFARMFLQLLAVGYVLIYIFGAESGVVVSGVLAVMILASSWIALNTVDKASRRELFPFAFIAIFAGGGVTLASVTAGVLEIEPWHRANVMIPLAGMVFANSMTSISLASERLSRDMAKGAGQVEARTTAFQAAMIPVTNALFAVGLVSLPGMMTGQILSGVSPLIAARYQIMVMCMIFASAGLSTACFLHLSRGAKAFAEAAKQ